MMYRIIIMTFGVIFTLSGCFHVGSTSKIQINDISIIEYELIKKDIQNIITKLNPPFDCEFDNKTWKSYREKGKLMCSGDSGFLYIKMNKKDISVVYNGGNEFWIPTKMIITNEHKKIQKIFLELATKYKKKYKDVKVMFYHQDLPKEGKRLL